MTRPKPGYKRSSNEESAETRFVRVESTLESFDGRLESLDIKLTEFTASIKELIQEASKASMELHTLRCQRERANERKDCTRELTQIFLTRHDYAADKEVARKEAAGAGFTLDYKKIIVAILLSLATTLTVASNYLLERQERADKAAISAPVEPKTHAPK